jgi:malate dehydrogenase
VTQVITDEGWLKGEFITSVQQRGAAILKARGASSAASAAVAIVDSVSTILRPTHASDWHSLCVCSDGSCGVEPGLISSFPIHSTGHELEIVQGLPINEFSRARIDTTVKELQEERAMVGELSRG